jgi:uncharacterized protein YoxC
MVLIDYLVIAALIIAIVLGIYLIFATKQILQNLNRMQKDVHELYERTIPLIEDADRSVKKLNSIADEADQYISKIGDFIESVQNNYSRIKDRIERSKTENPAYDLYKNLTAISKGISTFWNKLRSK